ncbi:MAG: hypothetical protein ACXWJ6_16030 [Xanthobacteraceae bacterium]
MKKLFAILAAAGAIAVATPVMAQGINVRIGDGYHRPHREVFVHRPRQVVVVREHRHWDRGLHRGWHNANRGATVIVR